LISLHVNTSSLASQIFLINHNLELVASSNGSLDIDRRLTPGIYKLKVRQGEAIDEKVVLLDKDTTLSLSAPEFASAALTGNTSRTHEFQIAAAQDQSRHVHLTDGVDLHDSNAASIFVFTRHWTSHERPGTLPSNVVHPATGLTLRTFSGRLVADLEKQSTRSTGWDPWAACTVLLKPGPYVLRCRTYEGVVAEQLVMATRQWQTQVFFLRSDGIEPVPKRRFPCAADFANLSVLMGKGLGSFNSSADDLRLTDVARVALTYERPVLSHQLIDMLFSKYENPMLGILGAHLMLLSKKPAEASIVEQSTVPEVKAGSSSVDFFDQGLFDTVIRNLRQIVGSDHPDVEALSLKCADPGLRTHQQFTVPPMLRRSWLLIVEASYDNRQIFSPRTWRHISRMTKTQPFFSWLRPLGKAAARKTHQEAFASSLERWRELEREMDQPVVEERLEPEAAHSIMVGGGPPQIDHRRDFRRQMLRQLEIPQGIIDAG
jgi:hypothetical protein